MIRGRLLLIVALLATFVLPAAPAAALEATCRGLPATHVGTDGDDTIIGTDGDDVVVAGPGNDSIDTGDGVDVVCAGAGDDVVELGRGADWADGGSGNDIINGRSGTDRIKGGEGDDTLRGHGGDDDINGGAGNDFVDGGSGRDTVRGAGGDDVVVGGAGDDTLYGGSQKDRLRGGGGVDTIFGGSGADRLQGQSGDDVLDGGPGPDRYRGGPGADRLLKVFHKDRRLDNDSSDLQVYQQLTVTGTDAKVRWKSQRHEGHLEVRPLSDGLVLVERVSPETYLLGLAEMPFAWGESALEAQAIAARTYLAVTLHSGVGSSSTYGYDICNTAACQVNIGSGLSDGELGARWRTAVANTASQILLYGDEPALAVYHSTAGTRTRSVQDIWGGSALPYLQGVDVPSESSPFATWSFTLPQDVFFDVIGAGGYTFGQEVVAIKTFPTGDGEGPYQVRFRLEDGSTVTHSAHLLRVALNNLGPQRHPGLLPATRPDTGTPYPQVILSYTFDIDLRGNSDTVTISGEGWGHQLGMTQFGAKALSEQGQTAAQILGHFYGGLQPQADPGFLPAEIRLGLDTKESSITLSPEGGHMITTGNHTVWVGGATDLVIRHLGNGEVALSGTH